MFGGETGRHGRGSQTIVLSLRVEQASGGTLPETEAPSPAPRCLFPAGSLREAALSSSPARRVEEQRGRLPSRAAAFHGPRQRFPTACHPALPVWPQGR